MAPVQWSDLPPGVVDDIAKRLDCDIDLLRLRSVCSPWRSSVIPRPRKPFRLPIKVPPIHSKIHVFDGKKAYYTLNENTLCRLSPPTNGNHVVDASNDWFLKVSEISPNVFSLLKPLTTHKADHPPGTFPKCLNLLDCGISEIRKSYMLNGLHREGVPGRVKVVIGVVKKVIVLWNYVVGCNFAALAVHDRSEGRMSYWKLGDENWTPIGTKGHKIDDVILYDGKCYSVDREGVLISLDSKMQLTVVASSTSSNNLGRQKHLLEYKSDLYLVSKAYLVRDNFYFEPSNKRTIDLELVVSKLNKCNGNWDCVENLGDTVFLLGEDVSVGVSAKDFEGFKGNSVYLIDHRFVDDGRSEVYGHLAGIYHLDNPRALTIGIGEDFRKLKLRPPTWLMPSASSPEP